MQYLVRHRVAPLALAIVLAPAVIYGQTPGTLDAGFGTGGRLITTFGGYTDAARGLAVQPDGKVVAAGWTIGNFGGSFALARYDEDGTLDTTFGNGGTVTTSFGGGFQGAWSVAVQTDGKIVAAGLTNKGGLNNLAVARYTSNGTLDTTFGTGGRVTDNFGGVGAGAVCVGAQPDGEVVVAGWTGTGGAASFALWRYNGNGTLDTGFGTGGRVITDFRDSQGLSVAGVFSVALQPDGRIVAAGDARLDGKYDFTLARYNSDGTLDASFG